jgi:hypothetical protein
MGWIAEEGPEHKVNCLVKDRMVPSYIQHS